MNYLDQFATFPEPDMNRAFTIPYVTSEAVPRDTVYMLPPEVVKAMRETAKAHLEADFGLIPKRLAKGKRRQFKRLVRKCAKQICVITNIGTGGKP